MQDIIVGFAKKKGKFPFEAYLSDNSKVREVGMSQAEAVGKLVMAAGSLIGITVLKAATLVK
jgi:hypothetical protein